MNAELLLKHFDRISDAPDAVARLRQFVLDLAVRGKLVAQDKEDAPASILAQREFRLPRLSKVTEAPFQIPANWLWTRFGDIMISRDADRIPVSKEERNGRAKIYDYYGASGVIDKIDQFLFDKPLLLIGEDGANLINRSSPIAFIARGKFWVNNHAHVLDGYSEPFLRYVELYINAIDLKPYVTGTAQPKMNQAKMNSIPVALPPEAEQHRIVAKVDELMALCDRLEEARKEREARRDRLTAASLHHLNNAAPGEDLRKHARFFINHLPKLTARPDQLAALRGAIKDLAVRGRLSGPTPVTGTVGEALAQIESERASLVQAGIIRQTKVPAAIHPSEVPFTLPESWRWTRIVQAALFTEYGTSEQSGHAETGVPVLKMGDLQDGQVILGGQKKVAASIPDLPALYLRKLDLLYNRTNSAELVGKTGIYLGEDDEYTFASYLIRIRFSSTASDPRFFNLAMNAPYFRKTQIAPHLKQQCGQANVNGTTLKSMLVPFPPVDEQLRIVRQVTELETLCDQLEQDYRDRSAFSNRLLDRVLAGQ